MHFKYLFILQYEPVFDSAKSRNYLQHIILYECQGHSKHLEAMAREHGRQCGAPNDPSMPCNAIVAIWTRGSEV